VIHNWNNLSSHERISTWKEFREKIKDLPLDEKLSEVAIFWSTLPLGARSLDFYTPNSWPTPWEILYHGMFCENTASIMMYYTLLLTVPEDEVKINIWLIDNGGDMFLVPVIDQQYVLNYIPREVAELADYKDDLLIRDKFKDMEIKPIV